VFKWYAVMATFLSPKDTLVYLPVMLPPLLRVINDVVTKTKEFGRMKTLAQEVLDLLQQRVGSTPFFEAYNAARIQQDHVRDERKKKKALDAVMNPEKTAQRKIQRNLQKKESRKRKVDMYMKSKPWKTTVKRARVSNDHDHDSSREHH